MAPLAPVPKVPLEDTHINRRPGVADPRDIGTNALTDQRGNRATTGPAPIPLA